MTLAPWPVTWIALAFALTAAPLAAQQTPPQEAVTDFSAAALERIEVDDLIQGLAPARSTRVRARPTIRLPLYFETGSAELSAETRELLEKLARAIRSAELESFRFSVEGHTDDVGANDYNQQLSERRAAAVTQFLREGGVTGERLQALGKGEARPAVPNDGSEGRRRNRRVEVVNLGQ